MTVISVTIINQLILRSLCENRGLDRSDVRRSAAPTPRRAGCARERLAPAGALISAPDRERLNALSRFLCGARFVVGSCRQIDRHRAMLRTMRRPDIAHPGGRDAHRIAAAIRCACSLEHSHALFLRAVESDRGGDGSQRCALDMQAGMGQGTECRGKFGQLLEEQNTGPRSSHRPLQSDFDRRVLELFAVTSVSGQGGMHEFLHQHAQHFDGFSEIGAQENLVAGIIGVRRMPALAETFAFAPG